MMYPELREKAKCLVEAYIEALPLIPGAIYQETGYQLEQVIKGFIPALLQMLAVIGISTMVGAGSGAAIGFFLGGVGAAPGALIGGQVGLDVGATILTWMGLKFLAESIGQGLGELISTLDDAVWTVWAAPTNNKISRYRAIDYAARKLAKSVGIFFRLVLQGVVAMILGKGGVSLGKGMVYTGRSVLTKGAQAASNETVAEVTAQLRQSKLPKEFADWVEQNWEDLIHNPKLIIKKSEPVVQRVERSDPFTPSQLKKNVDKLEQPTNSNVQAENLAAKEPILGKEAKFGTATRKNYRTTFFSAHPELEGKVVIHHAVEQQVMTRHPGLVSESEMHSLENLRGVPKDINSDIHLRQIRREWDDFYIDNAFPTKSQLLQKATEIDDKFGKKFKPPVR